MTQHKPKLGEASSVIRQQNQFDRSLADSTIANYREGAPPDLDWPTRRTVGSSLGSALSLSDDTIINGQPQPQQLDPTVRSPAE